MKGCGLALLISVSLLGLTACCGQADWWQSIGRCSACDSSSPDWS